MPGMVHTTVAKRPVFLPRTCVRIRRFFLEMSSRVKVRLNFEEERVLARSGERKRGGMSACVRVCERVGEYDDRSVEQD